MGRWPQLGVAIGLILSTGMMTIFNGIFGKDAFVTWGFRIPFLLSLVLVAIGLYIRLKIMETPQFSKVVAQQGDDDRSAAAGLPPVPEGDHPCGASEAVRADAVLCGHCLRPVIHDLRRTRSRLYVQLRAHRHAHRRGGRIRPGP